MFIRIWPDRTGDDKRFIADEFFVAPPYSQCNVSYRRYTFSRPNIFV